MIKNFILLFVAILLGCILIPPCFLFSIIYVFLFSGLKGKPEVLGDYLMSNAVGVDQVGNAACQFLFNLILIKKGGYKFGNKDETISSAIGKNVKLGTLSGCGRLLNGFLNKIEKDHAIKSINDNV